MSVHKKLNDPNLPQEERDRILGSFVRQHQRATLRERYGRRLADEHGITRSPVTAGRPAAKKPSTAWRALLAVAAALLLVLSLWLVNERDTTDELLASYLTAETEATPATRSGDDRSELLLSFAAGDYAAATARAESSQAGLSAAERYFGGLSYLRLERPEEAAALLRAIGPTEDYAQEAAWYLSLLDLRAGRKTEAIARLRAYEAGDFYYSRARRLLETLE